MWQWTTVNMDFNNKGLLFVFIKIVDEYSTRNCERY